MNKKTVFISGMHCVSCEKLLEDEILNIDGIEKVRADRNKNIVEIEYGGQELNFSEVGNVVQKFGYGASLEKIDGYSSPAKDSWKQWAGAVFLTIVILFLFRVFQNSGFLDRLSVDSLSLNFGVSFLVGIVASVSSCLAIVGAVIIAFAEKYKTEEKTFWEGAARPNLLFHTGRLATFFALGGILGLIGGGISISGSFISSYTIVVAVIMAWLGLNILGIVPPISKLGITMPKRLTGHWKKIENSEHKMAPFLLGASSFFLPCGFTQSIQILALASGSFWAGSLGLFFFALGTVPALLVLGVTASWTKNRKIEIFKKVAGMLVLIFAVYTFGSGLALRGVKNNIFSANQDKNADSAAANLPDGEKRPANDTTTQKVEMRVTSRGFEPATMKIKKNIPVEWSVYGDAVTGCTNKIIIPSLNIEKNISQGKNIINFMPTSSGEIPFSCWMGMVRGKFIVE